MVVLSLVRVCVVISLWIVGEMFGWRLGWRVRRWRNVLRLGGGILFWEVDVDVLGYWFWLLLGCCIFFFFVLKVGLVVFFLSGILIVVFFGLFWFVRCIILCKILFI